MVKQAAPDRQLGVRFPLCPYSKITYMGTSKLVKIIRNNKIKVSVLIIGSKYAFTLKEEYQNSKEILRSSPQYRSDEEARKEGGAFIEDIRNLNLK